MTKKGNDMSGDLYFEDFTVGRIFESPGATMSEAQILDFAWQYDPQPFHIDVPAAEKGPYGGLIASGFQTLAVAFRLIHSTGYIDAASMGSPGMDELRCLAPVRPGDTLRVVAEVLESRPSSSKPDRRSARIKYSVLNQEGSTVMTFIAIHIFRKRPEGK